MSAQMINTTLARAVKLRIAFRALLMGGFVLWFLASREAGLTWIHWVGLILIVLTLAPQILVLLIGRNPLRVTDEVVQIASIFRVTVPVGHVLGITRHPKTNETALDFQDEKTGNKGALRIPWKLMAEDQEVVTRLLEDRFGRSAGEAKS